MPDLKSCPFCGAAAILVIGLNAVYVKCSNPECPVHPKTHIAPLADKALRITQWNTRN